MNEHYESVPGGERRPEGNQARFDLKTIDTLISRLEKMEDEISVEEQAVYRDALFAAETLGNLLARHKIRKDETLPGIIEKLKGVKENIHQEARAVVPENKDVISSETANDNEAREQIIAIQEEINELYRVNEQIEAEQDRLKEQLVHLEMFVTEKEEEPANRKTAERLIEEYENAIQELLPAIQPKRLFRKNIPVNDPFVERREELEKKIIKTTNSFESKQNQLQATEEHFRRRLRELQQIIEEPFEAFSGGWEELAQRIRTSVGKVHKKLDEDFEERKKEIEALESQRDAVENTQKVA